MRTLLEFERDGRDALDYVLVNSPYGSLAQAVARLAVFSHPETVAQTNNHGIFAVVRGPSERRGNFELQDGRNVMLDDNTSPQNAFNWANGWNRRYRDIQFNHIWSMSGDPEHYTSLANICVMPAFLSKLSDTHPEIMQLLRYRAFQLYNGYWPPGDPPQEPPRDFGILTWADTLPIAQNLQETLRNQMRTKPKSRTRSSVEHCGWYFNEFQPVRFGALGA
jgi:hypothetical protein